MNVQRNVDAEFGRRFTLAFNQSKVCDLSQKELSNRLNVTQQCVSQWRKGERMPTTFQMKKIALLFDISVEWLYTGRGPMRPIDPSPYLDMAYRLMGMDQEQYQALMFAVGAMEKGAITPEVLQHTIQTALSASLR